MRLGYLWLRSSFLILAFATACTQYKPSSYRSQSGNTSPVVGTNNATGPLTDLSLVIANTKLAAVGGTLQATIKFGGQSTTQNFTPTGTQTTLSGLKLPSGSSGILEVEIYQGDALRFVAKKANTSILSGATVVIDDCLILRAPWPGTVNEGSCEWVVTEVTN